MQGGSNHPKRRSEGTLTTATLTVLFVGLLIWGLARGPDLTLVATAVVMIALLGGLTAGSPQCNKTD